jgi:hypothetical protein
VCTLFVDVHFWSMCLFVAPVYASLFAYDLWLYALFFLAVECFFVVFGVVLLFYLFVCLVVG